MDLVLKVKCDFNKENQKCYWLGEFNYNNESIKLNKTLYVKDLIVELKNKMEELTNIEYASGSYEITWDATGFSSGIYFIKMVAGTTVQSQKVMLIK